MIKRAKMRGVESRGMLCSARELGLADDASGLLVARPRLAPGRPTCATCSRSTTPSSRSSSRPTAPIACRSLGIARDVAAITGAPLALPATRGDAASIFDAARPVRIDDAGALSPFRGRVIDGIDPRAPTPAVDGAAPRALRHPRRSPLVDITNYVMLELGQPLHAYDDRAARGDIVVRFARAGREAHCCSTARRSTSSADLLIVADQTKPLGLAGHHGRRAFGHRRRHHARLPRRRVLESAR